MQPADAQRRIPDLEAQLIARRIERRRRARQLLDGQRPERRLWGFAFVVVWCALSFAIMKFGAGYASDLGLTTAGLDLAGLGATVIALLGYHVVMLDRKVKALTLLLEDDDSGH